MGGAVEFGNGGQRTSVFSLPLVWTMSVVTDQLLTSDVIECDV